MSSLHQVEPALIAELPKQQKRVYDAYQKLLELGVKPTSKRLSLLTGIGQMSLPEVVLALRHKGLIPPYNARYEHSYKRVDILLAIKRFELENKKLPQQSDLRKMLKVPLQYRHHLMRDLRRLEVAGYIGSYKDGWRRYYKTNGLYLNKNKHLSRLKIK